MTMFLTVLFIILCLFLSLAILIQQGKGDMGLGGLGGGNQILFGGSGGQNFFEKITWIMGAIFILGSLGLTILKTKELSKTKLSNFIHKHKKETNKHKEESKSKNNIPLEKNKK